MRGVRSRRICPRRARPEPVAEEDDGQGDPYDDYSGGDYRNYDFPLL